MQRILNAYTKYFNAKYKKTGHLFQGPFKAVHIERNEQLLHLSAYIHRNPREIKGWKNREHLYFFQAIKIILKKIVGITFEKSNNYGSIFFRRGL